MKRSFYLPGIFCLCFLISSVVAKASPSLFTGGLHDTTVCFGTNTLFTASVDPASGPFSYDWQLSSDGGLTWVDVSNTDFYTGAGSDSLMIQADTSLNGYLYRLIITNSVNSDTSNTALLTVQLPIVPSLPTGPGAVCIASSVNLMDSLSGGTWSGSNAFATVTSGGTVTGVSKGMDTIEYTLVNTCGTSVVTKAIRIDTTAVAAPVTGPSVTCVGGIINLVNANNNNGTWVWSFSNANAVVSTAGAVTGVAGGSDTVTYTFTNACNTVSSPFTVTIDTVINPGTISGPANVCVGSQITLSETAPGGSWISSSSSIAVIDGSGDVTGIHQGVATISYFFSNGCGASVATYSVTVSRNAASISGGDSVGVGNILVLSDSTGSGTWSTTDSAIAVVDSMGNVTGLGAGTDTIVYTVTNLCGTTTSILTLYVGYAPDPGNITGFDTGICVGSSETLSSTGVAGGVWSSVNGQASIDSVTGVLTGVTTGLGVIYYTVTNAFGSSFAELFISVDSLPNIIISPIGAVGVGNTYVLNVTPGGGTWTTTNPAVAEIIGNAILAIVEGHKKDTVIYTVTNICGTRADSFVVIVPNDSVSSVKTINGSNSSLNIYPNPARGAFTINLQTNTTEPASVMITNAVGDKVKELVISTNTNVGIKLDVPEGIYFLSAITSQGEYKAKIDIVK